MLKIFFRLIIVGLVMLTVIGLAIGLTLWALVQEPDFYQEIVEIDLEPEKRIEVIEQFEQQTEDLIKKIETENEWTEKFTQQQINLWLEDELKKQFPNLIPPEVSEPRVQFEKNEINIGFRLNKKDWKGVVSLKLKPWILKSNQLAVEISSINAGLIPIPLDQIMDELKSELIKAGWEIKSENKDEKQVLIISLASIIPRHPLLEKLSITKGELEISVRHLPETQEKETDLNFESIPSVEELHRILGEESILKSK